MTASSPGSRPDSGRSSSLGERAVLAGDGVAVRAGERIAELLGEPRLDLRAEHVLELAGLVVHGVPGHVEVVDQEPLAEAVAAHERRALDRAGLGERDAAALGRLLDQPGRAQAPDHLGDGGRGHGELDGEPLDRDRLGAALQLEDGLEVLLGVLRARGHGASPVCDGGRGGGPLRAPAPGSSLGYPTHRREGILTLVKRTYYGRDGRRRAGAERRGVPSRRQESWSG